MGMPTGLASPFAPACEKSRSEGVERGDTRSALVIRGKNVFHQA